MKLALVHDQLNEFGGAERVLLAMSEMYPDSPIYTAYFVKGSPAWERFKGKDIRVSWMQYMWRLASPLRFLAPWVWNSFDFTKYDVILGSSSWYITKGFSKRHETSDKRQEKGSPSKNSGRSKTTEFCYCHTPPRWLYGYPTSVDWQQYWIVRVYATVVGFFMRQYDFNATQRVDYFIANSQETARRISKFYRRDSVVVYPPIEMKLSQVTSGMRQEKSEYYLFVSRPVGSKGLELAIDGTKKMHFQLKIVGRDGVNEENIEYLGRVSDEDLAELYAGAKAFLALATDEDFGMTPVESMSVGTPVIGFNGGGYTESVIDGRTGVLFDDPTVSGLVTAIKKFESIKKDWKNDCLKQAEKFSKKRFTNELREYITSHTV